MILPLVLRPGSWIHRRVETVHFVDERTIRRSVSVDFTLRFRQLVPFELSPHLEFRSGQQPAAASRPPMAPSGPTERRHAVYAVPIAALNKTVLTAFDLRNEAGEVLPLLTRSENIRIAAAALTETAETYLARYQRTLGPVLRDDLIAVVSEDHDGAHAALERVLTPANPEKEARELLARDDRFNFLVRLLAESFLVLVRLDDRMSRRVIKFSYDEPFPSPRQISPGVSGHLGWRPALLAWDVPGASFGGSYHFEAEVPADLEVIDCDLLTGDGRGNTRRVAGSIARRAHVHVAGLPPDATAQVRVLSRARRPGILRAAPAVAILNALLLTLGAFRLSELTKEAAVAVTLLVLAPGLLAAYVARPGEHSLVTELLLGVRQMLFFSGALAVAAAGLLASGFKGTTLEATWWAIAGLAWVAAIALSASFFLPRRMVRN